jgi:hypothetical protein
VPGFYDTDNDYCLPYIKLRISTLITNQMPEEQIFRHKKISVVAAV